MKPIDLLGVGAIANLGQSWPDIWAHLLNGQRRKCDASVLRDPSAGSVSVAAVELLTRELEGDYLVEGAASRLCIHAISEALGATKIPEPLAVFGGTTYGESDIVLQIVRAAERNGLDDIPASWWRSLLEDSVAFHACKNSGVAYGGWVYSSCTSSMHALLLAALQINDEQDSLERAVVVGVDALSVLGTIGFDRIGASSKSECLPFHINRDGTLVGEGAAAMIIGQSDKEKSRLGRLLGLGTSCEAAHPTRPNEDGQGLRQAILQALEQAHVTADDIAGVVLHGTGTPHNDSTEAVALQSVFGKETPPATSIKGSVGHTMGASGLLNCLVALQASIERILPPTWSEGGAQIEGVDLVTVCARHLKHDGPILVNCSGFGGNNVAAVIDR